MVVNEFLITFEQGLAGYSGIQDTQINQSSANTSYGNSTSASVDGSPQQQVLLRFNDLIGAQGIPQGATILSATLTLNTTNSGNGGTLHRMLTAWSESSTWNSLLGGISTNNIEALSAYDLTVGSQQIGTTTLDVTSSVQAWANGAANFGWVFSSTDRNGWDFSTSESGNGPSLTIRYVVDSPPAVNTPPIANADGASVVQGSSVLIDVLSNDTDANNDALSITSVAQPAHGTVAIQNGQILYTPAANYTGSDAFQYTISDGHGGSSSAQVSVNITAPQVNTPPIANADGASVVQGSSVLINVLANDTDANNDVLSIASVAQPAHGTAAVQNGQILYTPAANYAGADAFQYTISDGHGGSSSAQVSVNVTSPPVQPGVNQITFAQGLSGYSGIQDAEINQNSANTNYGNATSVSVDGSPQQQVLLRFDDLIGSRGIPQGANILSATLTLNITNSGAGGTLHRMLTAWSESSTWNSLVGGISTNNIEALSASDLTIGSQQIGTTTLDVTSSVQAWANGAANFGWVINSNANNGWDFSTSESNNGPSLTIRYVIASPPTVNTPPTANADGASVQQGSSVLIDVLANDTDANNDTLSIASTAQPAHGTVAIQNGRILYTPAANYTGVDAFQYTVSDGHGGSSSAQVSVNVTAPPVNTPPTANADGATVQQGNSVLIDVLANDTDANNDALSIASIAQPAHGTASVQNGQILYTPSANYTGPDVFQYSISDGHGGSSSAQVSVNVTAPPVNAPPTANADGANVQQGNSVLIDVLANDTDANKDALSIASIAQPAHGTAAIQNGQILYTPAANYTGSDAFQYTISDGRGGSSSAQVSVNITAPPTLNFNSPIGYVATADATGSTKNFEHDNASKAFFFDDHWWSILPEANGGSAGAWYVHEFSGDLPALGQAGGWNLSSGAIASSNYHVDIALDVDSQILYTLAYGSNSSASYLYELSYDQNSHSWVTVDVTTLTNDLNPGIYGGNNDLALGLDQFGNPLVLAIDSGSTQGLYLAHLDATTNHWSSTLLDGNTTSSGGTNGNSKADFVYFDTNGVQELGIIYSQDGTSDSWRFAWHDAAADSNAYGSGWLNEMITNSISIDDHISAVSYNGEIYAAVKDASDALWLLSGSPGDWNDPIKIVSGGQHRSRPILTLDETNGRLYVAYQQSTSPGDVFLKVADANNPYFNANSSGVVILSGGSGDNFINPQSVAHSVGDFTDGYFPILAREDGGSEVWWNGVSLHSYDLIA
ncbi:MAG: cadherin-like domain-containing protein [Hyphomicrobiaceae bacterium]|nr:cadherin-like domain-containing protein [Hyphomicrobiaceae bacterium]